MSDEKDPLVQLLIDHSYGCDRDCNDDWGCDCEGYEPEAKGIDFEKHAEHLADILKEAGYRKVDPFPTPEECSEENEGHSFYEQCVMCGVGAHEWFNRKDA